MSNAFKVGDRVELKQPFGERVLGIVHEFHEPGQMTILAGGACVPLRVNVGEFELYKGPTLQTKACCCCGDRTEPQAQWHNRDTGYGLCERCIDYCASGETPASFVSCYGNPGVHYARAPSQGLDERGRYERRR